MFSIEHTLVKFTQALLLGQPVVATEKGEWALDGAFGKSLRQIFGLEASRLTQIARVFITILDRLESFPVHFSSNTSGSPAQLRDFKAYIRAAEAILSQLSTHEAPFAVSARQELRMRTAALKYRLEAANGGLNAQAPCIDLQARLQEYALSWKCALEVVPEKHLDDGQLLFIEEICRYPEFAELVLDNEAERLAFFNWSLRDRISPVVFVQYPALRSKIVQSSLNGRIGRMGGSRVLKLVRRPLSRDVAEKIVTLPFEGADISILDDTQEIEFSSGYSLTLAAVFDIFRDKYLRVGNLEFMEDGIINWNVQKWGRWNAIDKRFDVIDIAKAGWWKLFPSFETLALQEAKERYGSRADGLSWIAAATATRGRASLDVDLTHAYLEVAIPTDGGRYAIFDFGKLANEFPATFVDTLAMVCNTVHATIAHPDENVFYTHRQHAQHVIFLTPAEGFKLMESIRKDMISSRGLNFVYQVESENCAKWVHEKLEAAAGANAIPNMFVMSIFGTEPLSFLGPIINFCKIFPESWRIKALTFFHLPLGASKGHWVLEHGSLVWRALTHHPFWETGTIYLPCFLHRQKELGHLCSDENILKNISDEADGVTPIRSVSTRGLVKDASLDPQGQKGLVRFLSRLYLSVYENFRSLLPNSGSPREGPPPRYPDIFHGMKFARL